MQTRKREADIFRVGRLARNVARLSRRRRGLRGSRSFQTLPNRILTDIGVHRDRISGKLTLL